MSGLRKSVLAGGTVVLGVRAGDRLLRLVRTTILARLLAPDDFGLFGLALLSLSVVEALSTTGFDAAVIQRRGDVRPHLDTAWTVEVLRGVVLAGVLWGTAPLVGAFFGESATVPLLRTLALNAVIIGLTNSGIWLLQKELEFGRLVRVDLAGTLIDFAVSVSAALILRNAWALVWGTLAGNTARLLVSHLVAPRVRPGLDRQCLGDLLRYGRWVWGARIAHFLLNEGDDLLVGRMLGTTPLGLYQLAFIFANLPATEISHVISRVTLPAYAKLQDDAGGRRKAYLQTVAATSLVAAPVAVGIFVVTPGFVRLVLGEGWMPMVVPMRILTVWGYLRAIAATTGPVFQGTGRPELVTRLVLLRLAIMAALIVPLIGRWELTGASVAVVTAAALTFPVASRLVIRIVGCGTRAYLAAWSYPLLGAGAMGAAVGAFLGSFGPAYGRPVLLAGILLGVLLYLPATPWITRRAGLGGIGSLLPGRSERTTGAPGTDDRG